MCKRTAADYEIVGFKSAKLMQSSRDYIEVSKR